MYKHIILAYDGSITGQKALLELKELAHWGNPRLTLVAVAPHPVDVGSMRQPAPQDIVAMVFVAEVIAEKAGALEPAAPRAMAPPSIVIDEFERSAFATLAHVAAPLAFSDRGNWFVHDVPAY